MNVSNVGRQRKRKPHLAVLFGNKNGTKEPSPRRILSLLLALVIVVGLLPTAALADDRDEFAITISMEGATLGQGFYVEPRRYTLDQINKLVGIENLGPYTSETVTAAVATYAMLLDQKIEYTMTGTWEKDTYLSGIYQAGQEDREVSIPEVILSKSKMTAEELTKDGVSKKDYLSHLDYNSMSGWMISVKNELIQVGISQYPLENGDVIRWQFSLYGYGADLGQKNGDWADAAYFNAANKDALYAAYAVSTNAEAKQAALPIMKKLDATQAEVDAACKSLRTPVTGPTLSDFRMTALGKAAQMNPEFNSQITDYEVVVPETALLVVPNFSAPDGALLSANYYRTTNTEFVENAALKSGKALSGLLVSGLAGNDLTIRVSKDEAVTDYHISILRKLMLKGLDGVTLSGKFAEGTTSYEISDNIRPGETFKLKPRLNTTTNLPYSKATSKISYNDLVQVTINGQRAELDANGYAYAEVEPVWRGNVGTVTIQVAPKERSEVKEDEQKYLEKLVASDEYVFTCTAKPLRLELSKKPNKTEYLTGQEFDPSGMEVVVVWSEDKKVSVPFAELICLTPGVLTTGMQAVKFSYLGEEIEVPITVTQSGWTLSGSGTQADPYRVSSQEDLFAVMGCVNSGDDTLDGKYLLMTRDLTLPDGWTPIGTGTAYVSNNSPGAAIYPFEGIFDGGGHTLTVPVGGRCLIGFPNDCTIRNLNVYGEQIEGYGLVDNYTVGVGCTIENVTLKSGTKTLKSGFIGGYGNFTVTIRNCTIEKDVVIGYDRKQSNIGGFAGEFNGYIENCVNHGTVYGVQTVGGIVADKGQTMRIFNIRNCTFDGELVASGKGAGGIVGSGYGGTGWGIGSAPNTPGVTIFNCCMSGSVTGADYVGGILGVDLGIMECLEKAIDQGWIMNNLVTGTVSATGTPESEEGLYLGAIVGYYRGINANTHFAHNYYVEDCGAERWIGGAYLVNTSAATHETWSGATYVNSADENLRQGNGTWVDGPFGGKYGVFYTAQRARDDDILGQDAKKAAAPLTREQLSSGEAAALLNQDVDFDCWSGRNWGQQGGKTTLSNQPIPLYLDFFTPGSKTVLRYHDKEFDTSDVIFKVTWSDGSISYPDGSDIQIYSYFATDWPYAESQERAKEVCYFLRYQSAVCASSCRIVDSEDQNADFIVSYKMWYDEAGLHGEQDETHTYAGGGLKSVFTGTVINTGSRHQLHGQTVLDIILEKFQSQGGFNDFSQIRPTSYELSSDGKQLVGLTWVEPLTLKTVTLKNGDNGPYSCWTAAVNEIRTEEQFAQKVYPNDMVYIYWTDDVRQEEKTQKVLGNVFDVIAAIDAIGTVSTASKPTIDAAREAYEMLKPDSRKSFVRNYQSLLEAEIRYAELTRSSATTKIDLPNKPKPEKVTVDASKFNDVSRSEWYFDAVQYVLENGLMNGTSANEFSPNANTTRSMIVTILARMEGVNASGGATWYAHGREWAMGAGVSDGTNMEGKITREQLAAMLYRYAKLKGYDVSASADISAYTDASSVSSWATDAMRWAVGAGLINGRTATMLAPQGNATRAEVAAILMRVEQKLAK